MRRTLQITLCCFFALVCGFKMQAQVCTDEALQWDTNATWNVDDQTNTYNIGGTDVTLTITDPDNRNDDNDQYDAATHPYDPAGGCFPYPNAPLASDYDDVPGDGSILDPWDSDCNHLFTQSNGVYGNGYLTVAMNSFDHTEEVTYTYTFSEPVVLTNFEVADIDAIGLGYSVNVFDDGTGVGTEIWEDPGTSYQDEIFLSAAGACGDVALNLTVGSDLIVDPNDPQHIMSTYVYNETNDMPPSDPTHMVLVSTTEAITSFTLVYSNGPDDAAEEQARPDEYAWWSGANGATNGVSDDHAIRISGMDVCACPDLVTTFTGNEADICETEEFTLTAATTGGNAPYTYTWFDSAGTSVGTGATLTTTLSASETYTVEVLDNVCCTGTAMAPVNIVVCCPPVLCLPVTVVKN